MLASPYVRMVDGDPLDRRNKITSLEDKTDSRCCRTFRRAPRDLDSSLVYSCRSADNNLCCKCTYKPCWISTAFDVVAHVHNFRSRNSTDSVFVSLASRPHGYRCCSSTGDVVRRCCGCLRRTSFRRSSILLERQIMGRSNLQSPCFVYYVIPANESDASFAHRRTDCCDR